jgi:hypothetical protein
MKDKIFIIVENLAQERSVYPYYAYHEMDIPYDGDLLKTAQHLTNKRDGSCDDDPKRIFVCKVIESKEIVYHTNISLKDISE